MNKIYKWFRAHTARINVWRVTYADGKTTRLLYKDHAEGQKGVFGGKMWIDYEKGYF